MRRAFDILFSVAGLFVLSPLILILAFCIKSGSKGPIFYRQERVGRHGVTFYLIKFRSMHVNADKKGLLLTVGEGDNRITKIGQVIRKYKLDELPQLVNVLKGEMSIVGPRPEVKKYVALYTSEQRKVLNVLPGITDMASIVYKNENDLLMSQADPEQYYIDNIMPDKIRLNQIYINSPSVKSYFQIIFLTVKEVFGSKAKVKPAASPDLENA